MGNVKCLSEYDCSEIHSIIMSIRFALCHALVWFCNSLYEYSRHDYFTSFEQAMPQGQWSNLNDLDEYIIRIARTHNTGHSKTQANRIHILWYILHSHSPEKPLPWPWMCSSLIHSSTSGEQQSETRCMHCVDCTDRCLLQCNWHMA